MSNSDQKKVENSEKKVALVTGAARGIGAACARALNEAGYRVALHYRSSEDAAKEVCATLTESQIFSADLSQAEECRKLVKDVVAYFGRIDVLVNNAGMAIDQILPFYKDADFDTMISTNLKPVFMLSKLCSKKMIRPKKGRIINISSVVGHTGNGGQSVYCATKGAITAFTKSIAMDLAGFGITANCVAPGFIQTKMTSDLPEEVQEKLLEKIPLKKMGEPKDIAAAVRFLASDDAGYITGTTLHVNGGLYTT